MSLNDFMVNLHESDVAELEFKPATPASWKHTNITLTPLNPTFI